MTEWLFAVGGFSDSNNTGATWIFERVPDGKWRQQGGKLVGTGAVGPGQQGSSVSLSADGNVLAAGYSLYNGCR